MNPYSAARGRVRLVALGHALLGALDVGAVERFGAEEPVDEAEVGGLTVVADGESHEEALLEAPSDRPPCPVTRALGHIGPLSVPCGARRWPVWAANMQKAAPKDGPCMNQAHRAAGLIPLLVGATGAEPARRSERRTSVCCATSRRGIMRLTGTLFATPVVASRCPFLAGLFARDCYHSTVFEIRLSCTEPCIFAST